MTLVVESDQQVLATAEGDGGPSHCNRRNHKPDCQCHLRGAATLTLSTKSKHGEPPTGGANGVAVDAGLASDMESVVVVVEENHDHEGIQKPGVQREERPVEPEIPEEHVSHEKKEPREEREPQAEAVGAGPAAQVEVPEVQESGPSGEGAMG